MCASASVRHPASRSGPWRTILSLLLTSLLLASSCSSCRRTPEVPPDVYREAVTAFYTALAALETSQELLAREKLDRVIELVPHEPAGWANLGLLLLRQQEVDAARERLAKAAELAPDEAQIAGLRALAEGRAGNTSESIRLWREALTLDPSNLRAAYSLAQELERSGGAEGEAEAQRVLETLLGRTENLAARLEYARITAKRGDAAALSRALEPLTAMAGGWPEAARERLDAVRESAAANPRAAATQVAFLKNVLVREPVYRRALAEVTTPLDAIGKPLERFIVLETPAPRPAAPDTDLTFTVSPASGLPGAASWAGVVVPDGDRAPLPAAAGADGLVVGEGAKPVPFPVGSTPGPDAVASADLNYDFRTDLVLAGAAGLAILHQGDDGGFTDVTSRAKLPADVVKAALHGVWPADVDVEGDLDIVAAPVNGPVFVLRNNGDGTFVRQQPFGPCERARGFVWADLDGEGVPDAACLEEAGTVRLFVNLRGGAFEPVTVPPAGTSIAAIAAAEASGDTVVDLLAVTQNGAVLRLSPPQAANTAAGGWTWSELARLDPAPAGLAPGSARLVVADLDNNAAVDLVVSAPSGARVLLGSGPGTFSALPSPVPLDVRAAADLDQDGRLELVGLANGRAAIARSRGARAYHWQRLRPRAATATGDQRINSFGIGGEAEVRTGLHLQKVRITDPIVHVGLGEAQTSEVIRIIWPNGVLQSEFDQSADATVAASQRLKGSCPWLFAWNGREMAFVTDLIWRSPLGLRINAQDTADVLMTADWVKVGGAQLVPRDGAYDLRITAELWETHFFDLVSLAVVDHPAGTEVFVDERFAVPAPELRAVVTGPVQPFASAVDDRGTDVREIVNARDDRHLDFAGRGPYQGVTREHFVELVLPDDAPRTGPIYLVGQGWVHPTDSSINVAIGQGSHAPPTGLALSVADAGGRFRVVRPNLGFPSGKDKTVLIDLTGVFPERGPRRLRLSTNLEIFWDRLGWAVGRPDVEVEPRRLPLASADLRYRGFSVTQQTAPSSPERPRYQLAGTAPRWLDLEGYHTRFGDVLPLLRDVDDRYVIMNAGDELALRFPEVPPPPDGMVRDFIVIGDGWVKDGDFNTDYSRTVLPLPTHARARYDVPPRTLEDDPVYRRHAADFAEYHTRYVSPDRIRGALRAGSGMEP